MIWARTRPLPTSAAPPGAGASRGPTLGLAAVLAIALAHAGVAAVDERALPTAVEVWRWRGSADVVASGDGVVFVAGDGRLSALDARDGEERWSTALAADALTVAGDVLFVAGDGRFSAVDLAHGDVRWSTSVGEKRAFAALDPKNRPLQVGDRLFVPTMYGIAVLDMLDGALVARVDFGRYVHRLLGPPVVAHVSHGHHTSPRSLLVRFDERSGAELARLELGNIAGIEPVGDRLTVVEGPPWSLGPDGPRDHGPVWALSLDSQLRILWRRELQGLRGGVLVARSGDRLLVYAVERPFEPHELDPRDGRLTPLPVSSPKGRLACTGGDGGGPLHLATEDARAPARVTREGEGGWTIELPGKPRACLDAGEELLLQVPGRGERSLLFVLDAATGREKAVRYLPRQWDRPVAAAGGRLILQGVEGLLAIDPHQAGPADEQTRTMAEAVAEVLAWGEGRPVLEVIAELQALGPKALPFLVAAIPRLEGLDDSRLVAVARVLADARYEPAAAPLAAALDRGKSSLLVPLTEIAGPAQVATLARHYSGDRPWGCNAALAAFGRIGTPEALAALAQALEPRRPADAPWFAPPPLPQSGPCALAAAAAAAAGESGESWVVVKAYRRAKCAVLEVDGQLLRIFGDPAVGGTDEMWVADPRGGDRPDVFYLGPLGPLGPRGECGDIEAGVRQGSLHVDCKPRPSEPVRPEPVDEEATERGRAMASDSHPSLRLPLGGWQADRDGDGLTDRLEQRLGLSPARADSDGDGIPDAVDGAPNGGVKPRSETDDQLLAAVATHAACLPDGQTSAPLLVSGTPELEWRGRDRPIIAVADPDHVMAGLPLLQLEVNSSAGDATAAPLAPGERLVVVRHGTARYEPKTGIVLRRVGSRWVVTRFEEILDPYGQLTRALSASEAATVP